MKLKALLAAVFVAGLVVSMAVAAPAEHGKGKNGTTAADTSSSGGTTTTGDTGHKGKAKGHAKWAGCHPKRAAVLVGEFAGAGTDSFAMSVEGGNRVGKKLYGKQVTVNVTGSTKFRRSGRAKLADLETGDLVLVQGKACKLDATALTLVAKKVVVLSRSDDDEGDEDEGTTTSSTTETTSTTSTSPTHS